MNEMKPEDIGYMAGIFEGEGWIVTNKRSGARLSVAMTDFDVIEKLHSQTGIGRLHGPFIKKTGKKPQLEWNVNRQKDLADLLNAILPFLCDRRTIRVGEALEMLERQRLERERRLVEFVCGHPKSEENTYHFPITGPNAGKTACRTCSRARSKK